jgi:alkanesulfonate monooxygenase SsuD/methylene tetrahydromethanopterin reductase-like flavin-dependent oxidoreductase (luciferase family)
MPSTIRWLAVQLALLDNLSKGRIDVGIGKGTVYNEYEFVGHGLRSHDSRERMARRSTSSSGRGAKRRSPTTASSKDPHPRHSPQAGAAACPPLWRSVISPGSFAECGKLGVPILTARLPVQRIKERWATYAEGIDAGGHDEKTKARLLAQSALWRNVYVAGPTPRPRRAGGAARRDAHPRCMCVKPNHPTRARRGG